MKLRLATLAILATFLVSGCLSIKVEDFGYEVLRDADGQVLVDSAGKAQTVHKGQRWKYSKHWFEQTADEIDFSRKPGDDVTFTVKNYRDQVSAELNKLVDTSFRGAAELAAKVGAAIATCGGSVAGESAYSALRSTISKFVSRGGDASKATVTCSDGSCTITDGSVTESCKNCMEAD